MITCYSNSEVWQLLGRETIGLIRWSTAHKVETPHCAFETIELLREGKRWQRIVLHTPKAICLRSAPLNPYTTRGSIRKHFIRIRKDYELSGLTWPTASY